MTGLQNPDYVSNNKNHINSVFEEYLIVFLHFFIKRWLTGFSHWFNQVLLQLSHFTINRIYYKCNVITASQIILISLLK